MAALGVLLVIGFFWLLAVWTRKAHGAVQTAGAYCLAHTLYAAVVLAVMLPADGDERFVLLFSLGVIAVDLPILPAFELIFESRSWLTVAFWYTFLGGAAYAIIGLVVGGIASLVRRRRRSAVAGDSTVDEPSGDSGNIDRSDQRQ